MSVRNKLERDKASRASALETPENFHTKREHTSRSGGPGMERTLDRSQNMARDIEQDPKRESDREDGQLDTDFDGEDDLGRDKDVDDQHPSVRGI